MDNRYIAYLDVLGFRKKVMSDKCEEFLNGYNSQLQINISSKQACYSERLQFVIMSDAIVIISKQNDPESFAPIVMACSNLQYSLLRNNIPIRGAISYGPIMSNQLYNSNNIFVAGKALIEAYDLEKKQNWLGIILCPSVEEKHSDYLRDWSWDEKQIINNFFAKNLYRYLYKYNNIPIHKPNSRIKGFVVFPRTGLKGNTTADNDDYLNSLKNLKNTVKEEDVLLKYDESISFISEIDSQYNNETEREI